MVVSLVRFCGGAGRFRKAVPSAGAGGALLEGGSVRPGRCRAAAAHACWELTDTVSPVMYEA